jgi:hypothetical protein
MQAILTKYLGPTNNRGSRYKATCEAGSVTLHGDHALNSEENHVRVARALITKLGWWHNEARGDTYGGWTFGGTPDGYAFVCAVSWARLETPAGQAVAAATAQTHRAVRVTLSSREGMRAAGFPEAAVRGFHNRHED